MQRVKNVKHWKICVYNRRNIAFESVLIEVSSSEFLVDSFSEFQVKQLKALGISDNRIEI